MNPFASTSTSQPSSSIFGPTTSKPRPVVVRADTLPSPPPTDKRKRQNENQRAPLPQSHDDPSTSSHLPPSLSLSLSDNPFASPTQTAAARRRAQRAVTPPSRERTPEPVRPPPPSGWDSPGNPFVVREGEQRSERRKVVKPDKMCYVFRGKRITYDVPIDALLAPEDPSDSPFPDPSPRLLFPPPPVTPPSTQTTSMSFLDKLRGAEEGKRKASDMEFGLMTPRKSPVKRRRTRNVDEEEEMEA
ncbi:hypothetical protein MNV49_004075 [Pseudohyphozyma bogoriensis]|nr:hypothetical protein MNV49_004075 [Pseudohyphozyma bogoriensis]